MASIAIMIGAAVVNAIAFTAGNALYDQFGRSDDRFRHDKALEDLQKANMEWNEKRAATLDWINEKLRDKSNARAVFDDVDRALDFYNETHPDGPLVLPPRPQLNEFFKPSVEQSYYNLFVAAIGGGVVGYLAFKSIRN
jgi:hypothetical protein